ncbi:MAG: DUF4910 domain-containing protein [Promethearchaeota archaeon]
MFGYNQKWDEQGKEIYDLIKKLFPICRSITGNGLRETLNIIKGIIPIDIIEVPSGTKVFDWIIPKEWNINDAYIKNSNEEKIVDFKKSNLHVVSYSIPIRKKMDLKELKKKIHTLPEYPDYIPYLTSYYQEDWGFCIAYNQYKKLENDMYEVVIDSNLKPGSLSYGELFIKGQISEEILLTSYICHPSLCNDNLSGPTLLTILTKYLLSLKKKKGLYYSYRILFIPETIGAITWLSLNEGIIKDIKYGLVLTCLGDPGDSTYKKTRKGNSLIDIIVEKVLSDSKEPYKIIDFFPSGSDERQFSSPAFDLSVGSLVRSLYGCFPEYHTSADNLNFVKPKYLANSFKKYWNILYILENNKIYQNLNPKCEPHLRKRGLSSTIGGKKVDDEDILVMFWILNFSDGKNSLLDISIRSKINFGFIKKIANILHEKSLLEEI